MCADRDEIEQLRKSLLKKKAQQHNAPADSDSGIVYRRDLSQPQPSQKRRHTECVSPGPPVILEHATGGRQVRTPNTTAWVIDAPLGEQAKDLIPFGQDKHLCDLFAETLADQDANLNSHLAKLNGLDLGEGEVRKPLHPEDIIFFDLETTGLGNSPVFMVGIMVWEAGQFVVRQFFARNYAEESAIIEMFAQATIAKRLLVSFNGKSFDLPYIRTRAAATGVKFEFDPPHLDLLHVSRRAWRDRLPNCRLQTLETHICKRFRVDDIPGSAIPQAYHDYVRTENAWQMVPALEHNKLDLITLAELMIRLPAADETK